MTKPDWMIEKDGTGIEKSGTGIERHETGMRGILLACSLEQEGHQFICNGTAGGDQGWFSETGRERPWGQTTARDG